VWDNILLTCKHEVGGLEKKVMDHTWSKVSSSGCGQEYILAKGALFPYILPTIWLRNIHRIESHWEIQNNVTPVKKARQPLSYGHMGRGVF
jgi:hypothetical protein